MEAIRRAVQYLANLEWKLKHQPVCKFCDRDNFASIVYEDDTIIAIDNIRCAGEYHWLILPKLHLARDIENLEQDHLPLLEAFDSTKRKLLEQHCPQLPPSSVLAGYHRGRRRLFGSVYYPDIISIHHLHLHVIVQPRLMMRLFKYPSWLPLMWKSDVAVMREVRKQAAKVR
ncbi:hypothetical protein GQ53DRAFT_807985 [Thozetella sp. PMI_491]|nr:hypothetical protein GQ53DRAFT_807985 [Thozetella sp. PMI_491]